MIWRSLNIINDNVSYQQDKSGTGSNYFKNSSKIYFDLWPPDVRGRKCFRFQNISLVTSSNFHFISEWQADYTKHALLLQNKTENINIIAVVNA